MALYDFDFPEPIGALASAAGNLAASRGDLSMTIIGMPPGATVLESSYIGGDGRPHMITDDVVVAGDGTAIVSLKPPLIADIAANAAVFERVTGLFRLTSDDAGQNLSGAGDAAAYSLQFTEDYSPSIDVTFEDDVVTYTP